MKKRVFMFVLSVFLVGWLLPVRALGASEVHVTFEVVNGAWPDGASTRTAVFEAGHILCPEDIPSDMTPIDGFGAGRWLVDPVGMALEEDVTFRFYYQALIRVTFDANGGQFGDGSSACTRQVPYQGCCGDFPEDPFREGYAFGGWATESGREFSPATPVSRDTTVYALWRKNQILTLDANGGDWTEPQPVELPGGLVGDLPEPSREGWEFDHWNTRADGSGQILEPGVRLDADTTAYARWRRIFILRLEGNDGNPAEELGFTAEECGIYTHDFILPDRSRPGHRLLGWEDGAGTMLAAGEVYTVDEHNNPATLYAQWQRETCQVFFDGTAVYRECLWGDGLGGELPMPTAPEEGNFRFDGWYTAPNGGGSPFFADTPVKETITLYPRWVPQAELDFQIVHGTWAENGETVYGVILDENAPLADKLPTPVPAPSYKETGVWDSPPMSAADGAVFTFTCDPCPVFQLTFDTEDRPMEVPEGQCAKLPAPTRPGFRFEGWYTADGEKFEDTTAVLKNTSLFARWIPVFTLTYDANGGENPPAPERADALDSTCTFTVSAEIPTRAGYSFEGWADRPEAESAQLHGGDPCCVAGDTTLYAVWKKDINQINITFFDRGTEVDSRMLTAGESLGEDLPQPPERRHYRFLGWNFREGGTGEILTNSTVLEENTTVYACWQEIPRPRVTFVDRGVEVDWFTLDAGEALGSNMPVEPARKGFTFRGWKTENGTILDASTPVHQTVTVYASWEKITRGTVTFLDGDREVYQITLDLGAKIGDNLPQDPTRPDFHFLGWNTREDGTGARLYRSTVLREDLTVWAQWEEIEYVELTFFNLFGDTQTLSLEQNTKPDEQFPQNPTRPGYTFKGWYTEPDGQGRKVTKTTKIQGDTELYAYWRQKDATNAQTGDDPRIYLWASILLSSASALLWLKRRKA